MRGSLFDVLLFAGFAAFAFFSFVFNMYFVDQVSDQVETQLIAEGADLTTTQEIFDNSETMRTVAGNMFLVVLFVIMIFALILAYLTPANPIFAPFATLLLAIGVIIAVAAKTVIDAILAEMPTLANYVSGTTWFWNNYIVIILVWGALVVYLTYFGRAQGG